MENNQETAKRDETQQEQGKALVLTYLNIYRAARALAHSDEVAAYSAENVAKDLRTERIRGERQERQHRAERPALQGNGKQVRNPDAPATERQVLLLMELGMEAIPENLTRGRASVLIDEFREKKSAMAKAPIAWR